MIKFLKIRNVKSPEREVGNAGIDLFVPSDFKEVVLKPLEQIIIPSGLKVHIELNKALSLFDLGIDLLVENKSSISTQKGLLITCCEIDENYQGEIHIGVVNASRKKVVVKPNEKLVQIVPRIYVTEKIKVYENIDENIFYKNFKWKNRNSGAFGSTN